MKPFSLTAEERRDLPAFLESLTDRAFLSDPPLRRSQEVCAATEQVTSSRRQKSRS